jgi:type VI secretion system secreted protein Hcp
MMTRHLLMTALAGACLFTAAAPDARAENIYCAFTGQKQGPIKGDHGLNGDATLIPVQALGQSIVSPRDPATGLPTGRRQYQPLQLQKLLDGVSPLLFNALASNENLSSVVCTFYRRSNAPRANQGAGAAMQTSLKAYFRIKLTNANLAGLELAGTGATAGSVFTGNEFEKLTLTFQKIELTDLDSGTSASDDWESPPV